MYCSLWFFSAKHFPMYKMIQTTGVCSEAIPRCWRHFGAIAGTEASLLCNSKKTSSQIVVQSPEIPINKKRIVGREHPLKTVFMAGYHTTDVSMTYMFTLFSPGFHRSRVTQTRYPILILYYLGGIP